MGKENAFRGIVRYISITIVLIAILSLPASAEVLKIEVAESMHVTDEYNGTLTQGTVTGTGEINITNMLSTTGVYDVSLNFSNGTTLASSWTTSASGVNLDKSGDDYVIVHINALDAGESVIITYDCSPSRPVIFSETYDSNKILVNDYTNVSLTIQRNTTSDITGISLVKTASDINSNSTADFVFSNTETTLGSSVLSNGNSVITWTVGELNATTTEATLNFTATENDAGAHQSSTPQSALEFFLGNATLQFNINDGSQSGCGILLNEEPTATTLNFQTEIDKNQLSSSEGGNGGDDWGFTPTLTNTDTESISYNISAVTMYVTNTSSLEQSTAFATTTNSSVGSISTGESWTQDEWKVYDFPDPVPVGWIDVDLSVDLSGGQLSESYSSINGTYKLIEKIYVINGYLVEARKTITKNATDDQYDISIWVHNKGNLATPPTVVAYDIVPTNFSIEYLETNYDGTTAVTSPIVGNAYWWNVSTLQPNGQAGDSAYINYTVSGAGVYRLTDLFILGIDPTYSLNMQSTPVLKTGAKIASEPGVEPFMALMMMASMLVGLIGLKRNRKD